VPADHLGSAIGLYSVTTSASRMVGIAAAGVVLAAWGATACFLINSASYLIVLAGLASLRMDEVTDRRREGEKVRIRDGLAHVRSRPILFRTLAATTGVGMIGMNFMILVPAMVNLTFGAGSTWFGVAEVFSGAGSTAAGFAVGLLSRPTARSVAAGAIALGLATVATGLAPWLFMFCLLMFVVGLTATGFMTTSMTVTQGNADPSMRGRVSALQVVAHSGVMPIGSLTAGWLMSTIDIRPTMVLTGCASLLVGLALLAVETARPTEVWAGPRAGEPDRAPAT
jgi:predicted MFS family arabinose efflux permease